MEFLRAAFLACGSALVTGLFTLVLSSITYKRTQKKEAKDMNDKILKKLEEIENNLNDHIAEDTKNKVEEGRTRFLRFCDEDRRGVTHTEEHWNDILKDIDRYNRYCKDHPGYKNECAVRTIEYLTEKYDEHMKNNTFLGGKAQ
jgi:hypothetical protein